MTKHSRVGYDFRGRVATRLRAAVVGLAALALTALPIAAAAHPVRPVEARQASARRAAANRRVVEDVREGRAAKGRSGKPHRERAGSSKTQRSTERAAKPALKSKRHRRGMIADHDDDGVVLHRAGAKTRRTKRTPVPEQAVAAGRLRQADEVRAVAGSAVPLEVLERQASLPDGEDTLPAAYQTAGIAASVSAAPEPVTPSGKPSLPEKLHAAAGKAEMAVKADAASARGALAGRGHEKPSVLPEDHAAKAAVIEQAMMPMVLPSLYTRHGRLIVPPPLKGSHEILVHQNTMADSEGLDRIQNDDDLERMRTLGLLTQLRDGGGLLVNDGLPMNRRYARPWTARFASDMGRVFYARFHQPLRLNSAVRTVEYQIRLQRVNGNAAAVDGDGASPHLTGQALDFGKRGMSMAQIAWMRAYLAPLMRAGKVDVEEEFQQACFHVSVYRSYEPVTKARPKLEVAQSRGALAVAATANVAIR